MSEPWTREEQINYSVFHTKEAPPEWDKVWEALQAFGRATNSMPGKGVLTNFVEFNERYINARMSVD